MTNIDQFRSVFKSADKTTFSLEAVNVKSVMLLTGLAREASQAYDHQVRSFLASLGDEGELRWRIVHGDEFSEVGQLLRLVDQDPPDLICAYRNLKTEAPDFPYSLGVFVDVLTQMVSVPVMLLPTPTVMSQRETGLGRRDAVMAIADHLTGDHHLVNYAAGFTDPDGTLYLSHVEDEATFERYINTISKIPEIDTDTARTTILEQLLKEPHDYVRSCRDVLLGGEASLKIEEIVTVGHQLADYKRLVQQHGINLLVMNTKDEEQLAMHGLAYPLAVELRETPLLLL